jgi:PTH2 family peptidyl-tRNA hydrolase
MEGALSHNTELTLPAIIQPLIFSVIAFALGYQTRTYLTPSSSSTPSLPSSSTPRLPKSRTLSNESASDSSDAESEASDEAEALSSDIASLKANFTEEVKLVLVVNDSLKMAKGKIAAQAGHATLACAMLMKEVNPKVGDSLADGQGGADKPDYSYSTGGDSKGEFQSLR